MSSEVWSFSYVGTVQAERAAEAKSAAGAKGGGWLLAIALTLGKIADAMGERLLAKAQDIDTLQKMQKDDPDATLGGKGLTELNAEMQVLQQQLSQMIQALNTIVKALGEGNRDLARKQ
ncbi:hypothetical protein H0E84_10400 [Luteimonas sp. SJ-92]|uniref:Uncharacterized protein n=1 Tax=Luteimonas salinisoli TaxID=2752307 RepID=A0A853JDH6_9GAMM|nr:hypothetical protein [Luteimonas salinisoli]NZA26794.1 hypothetical protein [Luteimonas salinisoli]